MGDTAASLGNAMDELMRHQPTLKQPAMAAIVKVSQYLKLSSYSSHHCERIP